MAEQAVKLMTVDEFLAWDDGTDTRYELADGDDPRDVAAGRTASDDRRQRVGACCDAA